MKKRSMLFGVTILAVCGIIAKLIGAFYKIPLMHILGTSGMGVYYLVFPFYSMMLTVASSGISLAVVRMIAVERSRGLVANQRRIFRVALVMVMMISVSIGIFMIVFSEQISMAQGNISARLGYVAISPALIFAGLISVARGYFQGLNEMWPTSLSNLTEQIVKVALGLLFSNWFLQRGLEYGVFGAVLGVTLSEFVAFLVMYIQFLAHKKKIRKDSDLSQPLLSYKEIFLSILKFSLPATISSFIIPITSFLDSFLVINLLQKSGLSNVVSTSLYGISNGIVSTLTNLPIVLTSAIATVMVPNLSGVMSDNQEKEVTEKCSLYVKITWIIAIPCFLVYFLLAPEMINILYKHGLSNTVIAEYNYAYSLLKISSITIIYYAFLQTFTTILQSLNKPLYPCIALGIAIIIRTILCFVLIPIPRLNIYGLIIANIIFLGLATMLSVFFVRKHITFQFHLNRFIFAPSFAGLLSGIVLYTAKMLLLKIAHLYIYAGVSFVLGMLVYLVTIYYLKVFSVKELDRLYRKKKKSNLQGVDITTPNG